MRRLTVVCGALAVLLALVGCPEGPRQEGEGLLTGRVAYRSRISLPADSELRVALVDVSRADAQAVVIAEQVIPANGRQVPLPFALEYDPGELDPGRTYAVQARIASGDELLFASTAAHLVLTRGHPAEDVEVMVEPVALNDPRAVISRAAAETDANLDSMVQVEGEVAMGDTAGSYTAWFGPDGIRRLDEELELGELGRGERAHWFLGGELVYAEVAETRAVTAPAAPPGEARRVELRLWFAPSGELLAGDKRVDGEPAALEPVEVDGVRAHAAAVAALAGARRLEG